MIEIRAFRKNLGTWLKGISGMSALLGTRVYSGYPEVTPEYPLMMYNLTRRPQGDYHHHAWDAEVTVSIFGVSQDDIDAVENLIYQDIATAGEGSADTVEATLSDSDVIVPHVRVLQVGPDEQVFDPNDGNYIVTTRPLVLGVQIVGQ